MRKFKVQVTRVILFCIGKIVVEEHQSHHTLFYFWFLIGGRFDFLYDAGHRRVYLSIETVCFRSNVVFLSLKFVT